ncbi:MAG: glucosyl-3-phosphoglycerate synthase [Solirubrobacteraceae bacterium]
MNVAEWAGERSLHHSRWDAEVLRGQSASVCLPARECALTVGPIVESLLSLGVLEEVVVVDAASADGTAEVARRAGARVLQEDELLPEFGPVRGKGDAMWRALSELRGELVCYLDADSDRFSPHFAIGLLGALVEFPEISFVKAFYRRPFAVGAGAEIADGGGRVNHLLARPALALFRGELSAVRQPLAGEIAARRELLRRIPFTCGYGVEVAMLYDVLDAVGLQGMAQVDLELHHNEHKPLLALVPMAQEILHVIAGRLVRSGRLDGLDPGEIVERPPLRSL